LAALALLLVVLGGLGSALVAYRSGHRSDVLVVDRDVMPGHRMVAADFGVARVAAEAVSVVPAGARDNFVGSYATGRIPSGTLANRTMFRVGGVIPDGAAEVGITVGVSQRPAQPIEVGDVVRVYYLARSSGGTPASLADAAVLVGAARVTDSGSSASASGSSDSISLLLSAADAAKVVPAATQNAVALALLPDDTVPGTDFRTN
jgi:hypothetical protein